MVIIQGVPVGVHNPASFPLRVMSFVEKSVARLDQLERLEVLAMELGMSHYHYNAPPKYYSVSHTHTDDAS